MAKSKLKMIEKSVTSFIPAKGSQSVAAKHKLDDTDIIVSSKKQKILDSNTKQTTKSTKHKLDNSTLGPAPKKIKTSQSISSNQLNTSPLGLKWDADDYSCPYDSLFVILYNIWSDNQHKWSNIFASINETYLGLLADEFEQIAQGNQTFESARD